MNEEGTARRGRRHEEDVDASTRKVVVVVRVDRVDRVDRVVEGKAQRTAGCRCKKPGVEDLVSTQAFIENKWAPRHCVNRWESFQGRERGGARYLRIEMGTEGKWWSFNCGQVRLVVQTTQSFLASSE
jgi:hypothetical protein